MILPPRQPTENSEDSFRGNAVQKSGGDDMGKGLVRFVADDVKNFHHKKLAKKRMVKRYLL